MNTTEDASPEELYRSILQETDGRTVVAIRDPTRLAAVVSVFEDHDGLVDVLATQDAVAPLTLPCRDYSLAGRVFDLVCDGQLRVTEVRLPNDVPDLVTEQRVVSLTNLGSVWRWFAGDHGGDALEAVDAVRRAGEEIDETKTPGQSQVASAIRGQVSDIVADEFVEAVEESARRSSPVDGVEIALVTSAAHETRLDAVRDALKWSNLASTGTIQGRKESLVEREIIETMPDDTDSGRPASVLALADDLTLDQALERVL
jgi:hypothetical protein